MQQSNEMQVQKYLDIFSKYKWHGLIPAVVVFVILAVGSLFLPKIYESKCLVEMDRGAIENPLKRGTGQPLETSEYLSERLLAFSQAALKWNILSQVVDKVGSDAIVDSSDIYNLNPLRGKLRKGREPGAPAGENRGQREAVVDLLRKKITFAQKPPRFLVLVYRGRYSDVNAEILNALVSTLIEEKTKAEINKAGQNYEFIKSEMESYRTKLEEAEASLKEFKEQHVSALASNMNGRRNISPDAEFSRAVSSDLRQLASNKSELFSAEIEANELTARTQYIDGQLEKQNEMIVSSVKQETNPVLTALNQRIVDMEIELAKLRVNYTDLHPKVLELTSQLENLKKQREHVEGSTTSSEVSLRNPVYEQLVQDKLNAMVRLEAVKNRIVNLNKLIEENEEKVRSVPAEEQQLLTLTRNYEVTSNIYNMFLQKLEEVRLEEKLATDAADEESFRVLEYARASAAPVAPQRLRLLMVFFLVGLGIAFGIMAVMNFLDDSFRNVEEAKAFIKKPLLGTVPLLSEEDGNGHLTASKMLLKAIRRSEPRD